LPRKSHQCDELHHTTRPEAYPALPLLSSSSPWTGLRPHNLELQTRRRVGRSDPFLSATRTTAWIRGPATSPRGGLSLRRRAPGHGGDAPTTRSCLVLADRSNVAVHLEFLRVGDACAARNCRAASKPQRPPERFVAPPSCRPSRDICAFVDGARCLPNEPGAPRMSPVSRSGPTCPSGRSYCNQAWF
jgi:hypothetical protein